MCSLLPSHSLKSEPQHTADLLPPTPVLLGAGGLPRSIDPARAPCLVVNGFLKPALAIRHLALPASDHRSVRNPTRAPGQAISQSQIESSIRLAAWNSLPFFAIFGLGAFATTVHSPRTLLPPSSIFSTGKSERSFWVQGKGE